jgi:hypothetical protein
MIKEELKQTANELFASTTHNVLFANPRGEFFSSKNMGQIGLGSDEELVEFNRSTETEETPVQPLNAGETIAKIEAVTTVEDLKAFEADDRKTVQAAYTEKLEKLIAGIHVVGATGSEGTGAKE